MRSSIDSRVAGMSGTEVRRGLSLTLAAALATSTLLLAWAAGAASPVRAATTGGPCPGCVVTWGANTAHESDFPQDQQGGWVKVSANEHMAMALSFDGRVIAWGDNSHGQTTVPAMALVGVKAIAAGGTIGVALKTNGRVIVWGDNSYGAVNVPEAAQSGVVAIAAGHGSVFALKANGSYVAWGKNDNGQLNAGSNVTLNGKTTWIPYMTLKAVSVSGHGLGLQTSGKVVAWGPNANGQTTVPSFVSGATAVSAGLNFSLALGSGGVVYAWGDNSKGQLNVPCIKLNLTNKCVQTPTGFTTVSAGDRHVVALKTHHLVGWGDNSSGQIAFTDWDYQYDMWYDVAAGADFTVALWDYPFVPPAPTNVHATASDKSAVVTWNQDIPGAWPDQFLVTASPGGKQCSNNGTVNSCAVYGLANGTSYTFTVKTHNYYGWSPASAPSNAVTPNQFLAFSAPMSPIPTIKAGPSFKLPRNQVPFKAILVTAPPVVAATAAPATAAPATAAPAATEHASTEASGSAQIAAVSPAASATGSAAAPEPASGSGGGGTGAPGGPGSNGSGGPGSGDNGPLLAVVAVVAVAGAGVGGGLAFVRLRLKP